MRLEHRREDDVVLADEVHEARILALPVLLPVGRQVLRGRDISYRGVEPYVEDLALGTLDGNGDAPIQIAAHGTGLKAQIEPALALPVDVTLPLLVSLEDPLAQEILILVQRQVPVFGLALDGNRPRHGAVGVDQLVGRERRAALLALVAVCALVAAARACAHDIAVGKEGLRLLVVILHRGALDELALVVELAEKLRRRLVVRGRRGARIDVERDAQTAERLLDKRVVAVDDHLRRYALLTRLDGDGHAVLVAAAHRDHVAAPQTEIARVDIRGDIYAGQVPDMDRAVGVGQSGCYEITFELFGHKLFED